MKGSQRTKSERMAPATAANIETIARFEEEFLETRTYWYRLADKVAAFAGSPHL